jgi:amino acid adenylation domain-containing protein
VTRLLQDWVEESAARRPTATALVMGGETRSYGALEDAANRLAWVLRGCGVRRGDRICLLGPKSIDMVVGLLGVLKAGAMYVPLDAASPAARLRRIISTCDDRWILAAGAVGSVLDELFGEEPFARSHAVGWLTAESPQAQTWRPEFTAADIARADATATPLDAVPDDPAHILFTSGSTGAPKGVMVRHASVIHFVQWAVRRFGFDHTDRHSGHPPLHFDLSTFDIFGTFAAGGELHLVPAELNLLPHRLAEWIRASELTQWFSVPSVLAYAAKVDALRAPDFPCLRRVLWCGEVLPTPALIYWMRHVPHATFTNLYGPTETTIASSYHTMPACPTGERDPIPIGRACDGEELVVLDQERRPLGPDDVGELYIGGVGLSPGYWRDAERTAAAFVPDPRSPESASRLYRTGDLARFGPDGLAHFVGRADTQIKSRGYRVELGEIEVALQTLDCLTESAVVAVPSDGFEGAAICCAYVAVEGPPIRPAQIRSELAKLLPAYMLPAQWRAMERLPRNANGKVDRPALKAGFAAQAP